MEQSADGSSTWVQVQKPLDDVSKVLDILQTKVQGLALDGGSGGGGGDGGGGGGGGSSSGSGGVPTHQAIDGASVTFMWRGAQTAGAIIKGADPNERPPGDRVMECPPRVRVRLVTAIEAEEAWSLELKDSWVQVKDLLSCTAEAI